MIKGWICLPIGMSKETPLRMDLGVDDGGDDDDDDDDDDGDGDDSCGCDCDCED